MNVLIVYAHPEPTSFNGAMCDVAVRTLTAGGHRVVVSDLYAMEFQPVAGRDDFLALADDRLDLQAAQAAAAASRSFAPDLQAEMDKLAAADLVIFQFPLWWFSVPAILKGWVDRVFAYGFTYGRGASLAGKKAMCALTTGGPAATYTGATRGTIDEYLKHVLVGMFDFCDMEVLPSFVAYAAGRGTAEARADYLAAYEAHLQAVGTPAQV